MFEKDFPSVLGDAVSGTTTGSSSSSWSSTLLSLTEKIGLVPASPVDTG